jgi:hypothetical protein
MKKCFCVSLALLVVFCAHFASASAAATTGNVKSTPFSKCLLKPSPVRDLQMIVNGCERKPRCSLKQGKQATIRFKFVSDRDYLRPEKVIYGVLNNGSEAAQGALEVAFGKKEPLCSKLSGDFGPGGCEKGGIKAGAEYTFEDSFPVLETYPKIQLTVRYIVREEKPRNTDKPLDRKQKSNWKLHPSETLFCIRIPVRIV